jgi:hypothetical protein
MELSLAKGIPTKEPISWNESGSYIPNFISADTN